MGNHTGDSYDAGDGIAPLDSTFSSAEITAALTLAHCGASLELTPYFLGNPDGSNCRSTTAMRAVPNWAATIQKMRVTERLTLIQPEITVFIFD